MLMVTAGFTVIFVHDGQVKHITFATTDDIAIEKRLSRAFGDLQIIYRAPLDQRALDLLRMKPHEWLEWSPTRIGDDREL